MTKPKVFIALSDDIEINPEVKKEICLMKEGENKYSIGGEENSFNVTIEDMDKIVETCNTRGKEICIDYDHATLNEQSSHRGDAEAGGWCKKLERRGSELYATGIDWLDKAKKQIESKAYKYFSPVIEFDDRTGNPKEIHSIGITNHPALHNCPKLLTAMNDTMLKQWEEDNDNTVFNEYDNEEDDYIDTADLNKQVSDKLTEMDIKKKEIENLKNEKERKARELKIAELKILLEELNRIAKDANQTTSQTMEELYNLVQGDSEVADVKAFCDTLFKDDADFKQVHLALNDNKLDNIKRLALADMQKQEIESLEETVDKLAKDKEEIEKSKKELQLAFNDKRKEFNTHKVMLDLKSTSTPKEFNDTVNKLMETNKKLNKLLILNDCKSVDEINDKIVSQKAKFDKEIKELKHLHEADKAYTKAFNDGKITVSQKEWAKDFAIRDLKGFNDWAEQNVCMFSDIQGDLKSPIKSENQKDSKYVRMLSLNDKKVLEDIVATTGQDIEVLAKSFMTDSSDYNFNQNDLK